MTKSIVDRAQIIVKCGVESDARDFAQAVLDLSDALELTELLAMDEDNLWSLERANEVRIVIRDNARAALKKVGVG